MNDCPHPAGAIRPKELENWSENSHHWCMACGNSLSFREMNMLNQRDIKFDKSEKRILKGGEEN